MQPLLCFKVFLCPEYEEFLMKDGNIDDTKQRFAAMVEDAFAKKKIKPDGFRVHVCGHRGGIE
jgi:hypothetical protein